MKIFISWSGDLSNSVALVLREWLPSVIQAIEPYVSSEDIDKGARWSTDIAKELEASCFGILCVTRENVESPWLNFEAGALSKTIDKSRVCPLLFDLKRSEIRTGPLLQFQSTIYDHDDLGKLLHSLNGSCEPHCIDDMRLDNVFEVWWPKLQEKLDPLIPAAAVPSPPAEKALSASPSGAQSEILEELLNLARNQQKLLNSPETLLPPGYLEEILGRAYRRADIDPRAIEQLMTSWRRFREIADETGQEEAIPRGLVVDQLDRLGAPLEYILRCTSGRGPLRPLRRPAALP